MARTIDEYPLVVVVEVKEDQTADGVMPGLPDPDDLAARLQAFLAAQTRRDTLIGWRVAGVRYPD